MHGKISKMLDIEEVAAIILAHLAGRHPGATPAEAAKKAWDYAEAWAAETKRRKQPPPKVTFQEQGSWKPGERVTAASMPLPPSQVFRAPPAPPPPPVPPPRPKAPVAPNQWAKATPPPAPPPSQPPDLFASGDGTQWEPEEVWSIDDEEEIVKP